MRDGDQSGWLETGLAAPGGSGASCLVDSPDKGWQLLANRPRQAAHRQAIGVNQVWSDLGCQTLETSPTGGQRTRRGSPFPRDERYSRVTKGRRKWTGRRCGGPRVHALITQPWRQRSAANSRRRSAWGIRIVQDPHQQREPKRGMLLRPPQEGQKRGTIKQRLWSATPVEGNCR